MCGEWKRKWDNIKLPWTRYAKIACFHPPLLPQQYPVKYMFVRGTSTGDCTFCLPSGSYPSIWKDRVSNLVIFAHPYWNMLTLSSC